MHIAAFIMVPIACYAPQTYWQMLCILPVFGFFTLGIHARATLIYFPRTVLPIISAPRGRGFCFNGGRILAASILVLSGWLKSLPHMDLRFAITLLGCLCSSA